MLQQHVVLAAERHQTFPPLLGLLVLLLVLWDRQDRNDLLPLQLIGVEIRSSQNNQM